MTVETNITTDIVYPSNRNNRVPSTTLLKIPLHGIDAYRVPYGFTTFWFFDSPPGAIKINDVLDELKFSLAQALELYPPVSGTVHCDNDNDWHIVIDNSYLPGTPFHFEIKNTPFVRHDYKGLSPRSIEEGPLTSGTSVLAVKATQFSCGIIAIATSFHHQVADLGSFLDFVKIWAGLARGEPVDYRKIPKDWSREPSQFFPPIQGKSTLPPHWTKFSSAIPIEKMAERFSVRGETTGWTISKSLVDQLKVDIASSIKNCGNSQWISKGDAVTSLIFGALTRARESNAAIRLFGRSSQESQIEVIDMATNTRTCRTPQGNIESYEYFGNLASQSHAMIPRADLLNPTIFGTSKVALAIRSSLKEELSLQRVANYFDFFADRNVIQSQDRISSDWDLYFSNWCKYDLQTAAFDFGWGKPFIGMCGSVESVPGISIIMNGENPGDIFILLGVELSCVETLKSDPLLRKYATLVPWKSK